MLAAPIAQSTIDIYFRIAAELLPTPQKSHYTFNLRDVSKVIQGILMIKPARCTSADAMTRLWAHESMRVFHDRLINVEDKAWFKKLVLELLRLNIRVNLDEEELFGSNLSKLAHNDSNGNNERKIDGGANEKHPPLMFVDFLRGLAEENQSAAGDEDERPYEAVSSFGQVVKVLEDALDDYNISHPSRMNLVFFYDAVCHVARISRILRQKRGNAMLIGVGGLWQAISVPPRNVYVRDQMRANRNHKGLRCY